MYENFSFAYLIPSTEGIRNTAVSSKGSEPGEMPCATTLLNENLTVVYLIPTTEGIRNTVVCLVEHWSLRKYLVTTLM